MHDGEKNRAQEVTFGLRAPSRWDNGDAVISIMQVQKSVRPLGLAAKEIERMPSAFEHVDLARATGKKVRTG